MCSLGAGQPSVVFSALELPGLRLRHRLLRSATYEGLGDAAGRPRAELADLYCDSRLPLHGHRRQPGVSHGHNSAS